MGLDGVLSSRLDPTPGRGVWIQELGFVRLRLLLRVGVVAYLAVVALVTVLTTDLLTILVVGGLSLMTLKIVTSPRFIGPGRLVHLYSEGGVYVAVHEGSDTIRHGETPKEAMHHLEAAVDELS